MQKQIILIQSSCGNEVNNSTWKRGDNDPSEINDYVNQPIVIYWGHMATWIWIDNGWCNVTLVS